MTVFGAILFVLAVGWALLLYPAQTRLEQPPVQASTYERASFWAAHALFILGMVGPLLAVALAYGLN